jgi:hypothetical protein
VAASVEAQRAALEFMYELAAAHELPHALETYHVKAVPNIPGASASPADTRYLPVEAVVVPDDEPLPAAFEAAAVTREHSRELIARHFERERADWQSAFPGRPYELERHCYTTMLEGKPYLVAALKPQPGIKRKPLIANRLKPLGYKSPGSSGNYYFSKQLSPVDVMLCRFDFGTWRGTLHANLWYQCTPPGSAATFKLHVPFIAWTVEPIVHDTGISVRDVPLTSEKNLGMTFDNIAFIAERVERHFVGAWREAAGLRLTL